MSGQSQQFQRLKKRHHDLLQVIVSMKPSLAKKKIQQSFISSHPLQRLNDGKDDGKEDDVYQESIKKTIRDYFQYFDDGAISQVPTQTEQTLIDKIYRKFRNKELYRASLISKIPLQKVLAFAQHGVVSDVATNWGKLGKERSQHIQFQNTSTQREAVKNMIDDLKKKLQLKDVKLERVITKADQDYGKNYEVFKEVYGIVIPMKPDDENRKILQDLLEEKGFRSNFQTYCRSSIQGESLKLKPTLIYEVDGEMILVGTFMLVLGEILQPYLWDFTTGYILLVGEPQINIEHDLYLKYLVQHKIIKAGMYGFKQRFKSQQKTLKEKLLEAIDKNDFQKVGQLSPYIEPLTLYEEYKKLRKVSQRKYLQFMVKFDAWSLWYLAQIAIDKRDTEALLQIWLRCNYMIEKSKLHSRTAEVMLKSFDTDELCQIIKDTNTGEEALRQLIHLTFGAVESDLLVPAIKIIHQIDQIDMMIDMMDMDYGVSRIDKLSKLEKNIKRYKKTLVDMIFKRAYETNKIDELLAYKDLLTSNEISRLWILKCWKLFHVNFILVILGCLFFIYSIYVATFLKNRLYIFLWLLLVFFTIYAVYYFVNSQHLRMMIEDLKRKTAYNFII